MKYTLLLTFSLYIGAMGLSQPILALPGISLNSARSISGQVKDHELGTPLPGVSVLVKGTSVGTTTDAEGRYDVTVADEKAVLVFSFVGYTRQEVVVGSRTELNISLSPDQQTLNEVVVVGYGTVKKSDLTGAVSSVKGAEISQGAVASMTQGLQGRAAGVQITRQGGQPGEGNTVRIRGTNSFSGGEPLYVIDGIPVYNENGASLNPSDIESLEVLKDASATAIYGSRGANGVILVTTKRGKDGKLRVNLESYYGQQQPIKKLDMLNAPQYATLTNARLKALGRPAQFTDAQISAMGEGTNWQDQIFRSAPIQNYQLSLSGGNKAVNYYISGNYYNEQGIIINSYLKRFAFRSNVTANPTDKISLGANLYVTDTRRNVVQSDQDGDGRSNFLTSAVHGSLLFSPVSPVYNADGSYVVQNPDFPAIDNPVAVAQSVTNDRFGRRLLGNAFFEYRFSSHLKARLSLGGDFNSGLSGQYLPRSTIFGNSSNGYASVSNDYSNNLVSTLQVEYQKTFGKHALTALAVQEAQSATTRSNAFTSKDFPNDALAYLGSANTILPTNTAATLSESSILSYLGRINYNYNSKYLLTLSGRYDGSSRFGRNNRFAFFPSAALAWRVSEEEFIKNIPSLSDLKLRVSYGVTGNQEIGNYSAYSLLGPRVTSFNDQLVTGFVPQNIGNANLKWESTAQLDAGLDIGLFNNRITVTADYYQKKTRDVLVGLNVPQTSGFSVVTQNVGSVSNQGFEFSLQTRNLTGAFQWNSGFNISLNRSKVTDLGPITEFFPNDGSGWLAIPSFTIVRVGQPLGSFYGWVFDGIYQKTDDIGGSAQPTAKPGDIRYKDLNGDKKIDDSDRTIIGTAQPAFIYGFTNEFRFKNFDLTVFLQGSQGNKIVNAQFKNLNYFTAEGNASKNALDYWSDTNPSQTTPSLTNPNIRYASQYVEDGSYLRLKNIIMGYTLPGSVAKRLKISSLRVYVTGQNALTFTKYSGFDPEVNRFRNSNVSSGIDAGSYPTPKTWTLGLNVGF